MTTPVPDATDWANFVSELKDVNSLRFVHRLVEMQRQVLDSQVAQLGELSRQLEEHIKKMEGGAKAGK
jgi:hypothetical protein